MKQNKLLKFLFLMVMCGPVVPAVPIPAWFEENTGQYDASVRFFSSGASGGALLIKQNEAVFNTSRARMTIRLVGSGSGLIEGVQEIGAAGARFIGNHRERWGQGVRLFEKVRSSNVYAGIDVVHYLTSRGEPEFDFLVAPGADPRKIRLRYGGVNRPRLNAEGDVVFDTGIRQARPIAYQQRARGRVAVEARYRLAPNGDISFVLGRYDRALPLVIDPVLFSSYIGGERDDKPTAMVRDAAGNIWITGSSTSMIYTDSEPIQWGLTGRRDAFVARLSPTRDGKLALKYWTLIGGTGDDEATAIALDPAGMVCVTGWTSSTDFPKAGTALQGDSDGGGTEAFILRIDPNVPGADALRFSRVYGGSGTDVGTAIAVDANSGMYVAGYTGSQNLKGVIDGQSVQSAWRGGIDAFLVKVEPDSGTPLVYATYLGGSNRDDVAAISLIAENQLYITGYTRSDDFPVTFDAYESTTRSMYLAKLNINKSWLDALEYATFLGGDGYDVVRSMAVDAEGMIWLAGYTFSSSFPVTSGAYQTVNRGGVDGFALRFNYAERSAPGAIAYSSYIGGSEDDVVYSMTALPGGRIALAGYTFSNNFPSTGASNSEGIYRPASAFASILDAARTADQALIYSTVFDGGLNDVAVGVAPDGSNLVVCGYTTSFDFPATDGSTKLSPGGGRSAFVVRAGPGQ